MEDYECEHGNPAQPGGHTACKECPDDPARVKYRPTPRYDIMGDAEAVEDLANRVRELMKEGMPKKEAARKAVADKLAEIKAAVAKKAVT